MNLNLAGKKALVTGASQGIGRAIAESLAAEGAQVAVTARRKAALRAVLDRIGGKAAGHIAVPVDLSTESGVSKLCARLKLDFGSPNIVVHNLGGTLNIRNPLCSVADWRRVFRLNLEVAVSLNNRLLPAMKRAGWGRIIHISSVSGFENLGPIPYCAAKAALNAYTRSLGRVCARDGVVVCGVAPGAVLAPGGPWDRARHERPNDVRRYLREQVAMRRFARPQEIASTVSFLCSDHASQFAGSVIPIDGGLGRNFER